MPKRAIVVHYHELWLKGNNRSFFLGKFLLALRRTLAQFPVEKIRQPGDRVVIHLADDTPVEPVIAALERVMGIAYFGVARVVGRGQSDDLDALCQAAWAEVEPLAFGTFAVRAKRSDKSFPVRTSQIEAHVGRYLLERLRAAGRDVRVKLDEPDLTCRIEITTGPMLVYARKIPGPGGLPANTTGRMLCLLSGGYDSAVAAYKMMRRGAHLSFVHFWGGGARPGESSVHVARALVERLVPYQFTAKLYLVPFEPIQREIARAAPESYRLLLYRRMMLRIAERVARRENALAIIAGTVWGRWRHRRCKTWWPSERLPRCRSSGRWPVTTNRRSWPSPGASAPSKFPPSRFTTAAAFCCHAARRSTPRAEIWIRRKLAWMSRIWSTWG